MSSFSYHRITSAACILFFSILISVNVSAQSCPAQGTEIFPDLSGQDLIDALVAEYKSVSDPYDYDNARDILYGSIDADNDSLRGIYTGYTIWLDPNADPSSDAFSKDINAEHAWPQSKGASVEPAFSDMHHLYPAYASANSSRGNHPFAEVPDDQTVSWWRNDSQVSTPDYNFIDEYSERREGHPSGENHPNGQEYDSWEPREDAKGDIARSMFYFYTMYKDQADAADPIFFEVQKQFLRSWNQQDTVSQKEYDRTCAIATYQSDKVNPFVIDPTLADRAYFEGQVSQTNVQFAASVFAVNEGSGEIQIDVTISNPNPDTATTVDVVYTGGTADTGDDFETFTTQTLTFPEGSFAQQSVTLTLIDDDISEQNETILFELQNVNGPKNVTIGQASSLEITVQDNDGNAPTTAWINEFHYDNEGGDVGEFVELAVNAQFADMEDVNLTLYNGSGGSSYATYSGNDFVGGETENGITFYYVDLPSNGLQNGSPDGMSLDIGGELIQFISYEGTFTAVDGPAQDLESTDIGVEQTGTSPIGSSLQLAGTGGEYKDFTWEYLEENTKGDVNTNQVIELLIEPEPAIVQFTKGTISVFEDTGSVMIEVSIINPDPDNETTVEIALAGGTADEDDYEFDSPETLHFPAGSSASLSIPVTINDNELYEPRRTIKLALQNVSNGEIGARDTLEITIRDDDDELVNNTIWINEIHYQNDENDSTAFVEIVVLEHISEKFKADYLDNITIALYDGATGEVYAEFSGDNIKQNQDRLSSGHAIYYVDTPELSTETQDGFSLSYSDELYMFLSYGDSFLAEDGPAKDYESLKLEIPELEPMSQKKPVALTGSGVYYHDFTWVIADSTTKGALNSGQDVEQPISNEDEPEIAHSFKLNQNYPNPFNPSTVISYQLSESSEVHLEVFDMLGRKVADLLNGERKTVGAHQVTFDAGNLSSGIYIYRLSTSKGQYQVRKMLLMK